MSFYDTPIHDLILDKYSFDDKSFWDVIEKTESPESLSEEFIQPFVTKVHEKFNTLNLGQLREDILRISKGIKNINDDPEYYSEKVKYLLTLPQPEQRTEPWYKMREGMITASDWGTAIGENPNSTINKLLLKKLGYAGEQFTGNIATRWGTKYEQVATNIYEYRRNTNVIEFGLLQHPTIDFLGASPDGITPDGIMLEIKCPFRRNITGIPPRYYWVQVQGQLEVCRLTRCDFLECKLIEFEDPKEYFDDLDESKPGHSKTNGNEMGIVLQFEDQEGQLSFEYSKFGINLKESNEWMKEKILEHRKLNQNFNGASYWRLDLYSCVPIYRDKNWFEKTLPKLESFKKEWEFYKKVGYDSLLTKKKVREKPRSRSSKVETDLTKYDGFVKNNFGVGDENIITKEQEKLYEGVIAGVPARSFGFSEESLPPVFSDEETSTSERSDDSYTNDFKKMGFGFSFDGDDTESKPVKKNPVKEKAKKKAAAKAAFGFSLDKF